jgi:uncharacterized protein YjbI with pentapeptide repeats
VICPSSVYCRRFQRLGALSLDQPTPTRLSRSELCKLIEARGGSEGLDLSGYDLRGIDLSSDILREELAHLDYPYNEPPPWYSPSTTGIRLAGAILRAAHLEGALLWRGDFTSTDFEGAFLERADLGVALLKNANLRGAHLEWATLARSDVRQADFTGAFLQGADLKSVNLGDALSLYGASLADATLSTSSVRRHQLRSQVGEEKRGDYLAAKEAYLALKSAFLSSSRYADASWAYVKERQMEKKAHSPLHAWRYYRQSDLPTGLGAVMFAIVPFYVRHTSKWLFEWLSELSSGYGERPFRPIGVAILIVLLFSEVYFMSGSLSVSSSTSPSWLTCLEYSLAAFTTTSVNGVTVTSDMGNFLTSSEALLGIATLALVMFTLGNRISRS